MVKSTLMNVLDKLNSLQHYIGDEAVDYGDYVRVYDIEKIINYIKMDSKGIEAANKMYDVVNDLCGRKISQKPKYVKYRYIGGHLLYKNYGLETATHFFSKFGLSRCSCYAAEKSIEDSLFADKNFQSEIDYIEQLFEGYRPVRHIRVLIDTLNDKVEVYRGGIQLDNVDPDIINKWITEAKALCS
jgi:hypothetical protein